MSTTRSVLKGSIRWVGVIGSPLLFSMATGCAGPGYPVPDTTFERTLAPVVVSGQPGMASQEPATGVGGSAVVQAGEGRKGENESTHEREQHTLPSPKK